jgi:hypothetical protein
LKPSEIEEVIDVEHTLVQELGPGWRTKEESFRQLDAMQGFEPDQFEPDEDDELNQVA